MNVFHSPDYDWKSVLWQASYRLALITKAGKPIPVEDGSLYVCSKTGQIMGRFQKAHYAVGRVLKLASNLEDVPPGEYKIIDKEGWNYAYADTLRLKRHVPALETARKANNWAEKQMQYEEAMEALTLEDAVAKMMSL